MKHLIILKGQYSEDRRCVSCTFPFTLLIKPDKSNNISSASVALVFQLRAIDKRRLKQKLGDLKNSEVRKIKQLIKEMILLDKE
jgi:mRNA-degrading endonuclease toxin of MazEF toxin-antitoxin module